MSFLLGLPIFRGYVKFPGCIEKRKEKHVWNQNSRTLTWVGGNKKMFFLNFHLPNLWGRLDEPILTIQKMSEGLGEKPPTSRPDIFSNYLDVLNIRWCFAVHWDPMDEKNITSNHHDFFLRKKMCFFSKHLKENHRKKSRTRWASCFLRPRDINFEIFVWTLKAKTGPPIVFHRKGHWILRPPQDPAIS